MSRTTIILLAVWLSSCNGFAGEGDLKKLTEPPIPIADPDYLILRAVSTEPGGDSASATLYDGTVYFNPRERILDLRSFDVRTARLDQFHPDTFVILIDTTDEGSAALGKWTAAHLKKQLGIFVNDRLIAAPFITSRIDGTIVIADELTKSQAEEVLARLRRGGAAV